uniref:drug sensory protein A n=1 Tax=Caulacanthus ustulatus TaxID=31411 RepID=UPI0027D9E0F9|nr:drug sensory protein A [Caulacanthus ustulatus]WCH57260.1 drug sensory protein A [Caulacanthus ustulatus]
MTYRQIIANIVKWRSDIRLKKGLMVLMILVVALIMSGLTFGSLTIMQEDAIITDTRFCKDLGVLFASNILEFVETGGNQELASFVEKIYLNNSSIRYILLYDIDGNLFFELPVYTYKIQNLLQVHKSLFQPENQNFLFEIPLIKYNANFNNNIIDITIPLTNNGINLGTLNLGIDASSILTSSSKLIINISVAIFVSIWLMVIIGISFNILMITEPIKKLLIGLKNIASGNFNQQINLNYDSELSDLIISFNEMAEKLNSYEEKNVDQLMLEKMKLETIVSTIADGAILVDTELRLLFVNKIALKVFNWSNVDIIGKFICQYFPLHVSEALLPVLNNLVKSNYLYNHECETKEVCINFDYGSKKIFRFLLTTVLEKRSNVLTGVAIIIQDISREVKLNDAKNQFIANVSHELRTPLFNIGLFLETLLDYHDSLSKKQKIHFLNIANNETKRLSTLVNDILDLSRLDSNNEYVLTSINIFEIINDAVKASKLIANYSHIRIVIEFDRRIKRVRAHKGSLLQVLVNLISNSIKFTSIKGNIVLRVYLVTSLFLRKLKTNNVDKYSEVVRIEVIDEGIGVDYRDRKNIFDRFVRIENHVHTCEGTGLGLSIVKHILNQYGTKIVLKSNLLVGTSLYFDLCKVD